MNNADLRAAPRGGRPAFEPRDPPWQPSRRSPVCLALAPTRPNLSATPHPRGPSTDRPIAPPRSSSPPSIPAPSVERRLRPLYFEYTGNGSVSIQSSITGRHYRFCLGQRVEVDARDGAQLARIPQLHQV